MQRLRITIAAALAALAPATGTAQAVSPADRTDFEGGSSSHYPLGRFDGRFQQLHADLPSAMTSIRGHAYRRDAAGVTGAVGAFAADLSVELSISPRTPATASRTFTDNAGPSPSAVLPRTMLSFPGTQRPAQAPAPTFDWRIPYAAPFAMTSGAVLCVDVTIWGNQLQAGSNANFSAYLDAHESSTTRVAHPGFRWGQGCAAPGSSIAHYGSLELTRDPNGLALDVSSRYGVPTTATDPAITVLVVGARSQSQPLGWTNGCTLYARLDATWELPGTTDARGHANAVLPGITGLPIGLELFAQLATGSLTSGAVTLSDASTLTVPVSLPASIAAARIASASDRTAATGATSTTATVTEFF